MKREVSDEILSAYIDSELSCQDKQDIAEQIRHNPAVAHRVEQLKQLKLAVKQAYQHIPEPAHASTASRCAEKMRALNSYCYRAIAASILLGIGSLIGYTLNQQQSSETIARNASADTLYGIKVQPVSQNENNLLLHITSSEMDKLDQVLDRAEYILKEYQKDHANLQVEVVANSSGIDLLRTATTPYQKRIQDLRLSHDNIKFVACKNTLKKLLKEGKNISVLDGIQTDTPALDRIVNRINQGWVYIKI